MVWGFVWRRGEGDAGRGERGKGGERRERRGKRERKGGRHERSQPPIDIVMGPPHLCAFWSTTNPRDASHASAEVIMRVSLKGRKRAQGLRNRGRTRGGKKSSSMIPRPTDRAPLDFEKGRRRRVLGAASALDPVRPSNAAQSALQTAGSEDGTGQEPRARRRLAKGAIREQRRRLLRRSRHPLSRKEREAQPVSSLHGLPDPSQAAHSPR